MGPRPPSRPLQHAACAWAGVRQHGRLDLLPRLLQVFRPGFGLLNPELRPGGKGFRQHAGNRQFRRQRHQSGGCCPVLCQKRGFPKPARPLHQLSQSKPGFLHAQACSAHPGKVRPAPISSQQQPMATALASPASIPRILCLLRQPKTGYHTVHDQPSPVQDGLYFD